MDFTVANILTIARLVLTPIFVGSFLLGQQKLAFILFCIAGFTDLIDGTVARVLKQRSKAGAFLDPLADKLLMQSCFFLLFLWKILPLWFFLLALVRDITIVSGIIYLVRQRAELPYRPLWVSKAATLLQLAVAIFGLLRLWQPILSPAGINLINWHVWSITLATVLIVISGLQYVRMGFDILRRKALHHGGKL